MGCFSTKNLNIESFTVLHSENTIGWFGSRLVKSKASPQSMFRLNQKRTERIHSFSTCSKILEYQANGLDILVRCLLKCLFRKYWKPQYWNNVPISLDFYYIEHLLRLIFFLVLPLKSFHYHKQVLRNVNQSFLRFEKSFSHGFWLRTLQTAYC